MNKNSHDLLSPLHCLTIYSGVTSRNVLNDLNVYSLSDKSWVQGSGSSSYISDGLSKGFIAGVTFGSIVLLLLVLLAQHYKFASQDFYIRIKKPFYLLNLIIVIYIDIKLHKLFSY
jgi:hypothetical protein